MDNAFWTVERVAEFLVLKPNTIRQIAPEGRSPSYKIDSQWRFDAQQVRPWLESHSIHARAALSQQDRSGA